MTYISSFSTLVASLRRLCERKIGLRGVEYLFKGGYNWLQEGIDRENTSAGYANFGFTKDHNLPGADLDPDKRSGRYRSIAVPQ